MIVSWRLWQREQDWELWLPWIHLLEWGHFPLSLAPEGSREPWEALLAVQVPPSGPLPRLFLLSGCYPRVLQGLASRVSPLWWIPFPGGSEVKASACNAGDLGLIPGLGRSPGEGNATHSSILAWRIPWTEEPGGLQSMGSHRVRHDWATSLSLSLFRINA